MTMLKKPFNGKVNIQRMNETELNIAIQDLQKRGYELIKRGAEETDHKRFNYKERKGQKFRYSENEVQHRCWAIMQKVVEV